MSSINLERFRARHPSEQEALCRLEVLLSDGQPRRLTLDQFADMVEANSRDELALILGELAGAGLIALDFEIRSPVTRQPLERFKTLEEIPRVIHDATTDTIFEINLEDVRPIYAMPADAAS